MPYKTFNSTTLKELSYNSYLRTKIFSNLTAESKVWVGAKSSPLTSMSDRKACWGGFPQGLIPATIQQATIQANKIVTIKYPGGSIQYTFVNHAGGTSYNGICECNATTMSIIASTHSITNYICYPSGKCYYMYPAAQTWQHYAIVGCTASSATTPFGRLAMPMSYSALNDIMAFLEAKKLIIGTTDYLLNVTECSPKYTFLESGQDYTDYMEPWQYMFARTGDFGGYTLRNPMQETCVYLNSTGSLEFEPCTNINANLCYRDSELIANVTQCTTSTCYIFYALDGGVWKNVVEQKCINGLPGNLNELINFNKIPPEVYPPHVLNKIYATAVNKTNTGSRSFVWNNNNGAGYETLTLGTLPPPTDHCIKVIDLASNLAGENCFATLSNVICQDVSGTLQYKPASPAVTIEGAKQLCMGLGWKLAEKVTSSLLSVLVGATYPAWVDGFELQTWKFKDGSYVFTPSFTMDYMISALHFHYLIYNSAMQHDFTNCAFIKPGLVPVYNFSHAIEIHDCGKESSIMCHLESPTCSGISQFQYGIPTWTWTKHYNSNLTMLNFTQHEVNCGAALAATNWLFGSQTYFDCKKENFTFLGEENLPTVYSECRPSRVGASWSNIINADQCRYKICNVFDIYQPTPDNIKYMTMRYFNGTQVNMYSPIVAENTTIRFSCNPPATLITHNISADNMYQGNISSVVMCNPSNIWMASISQHYNDSYTSVNYCPVNKSAPLYECKEIMCPFSDFQYIQNFVNINITLNGTSLPLNSSLEFTCLNVYPNITLLESKYRFQCTHIQGTVNHQYKIVNMNGTDVNPSIIVNGTQQDLINAIQDVCQRQRYKACFNATIEINTNTTAKLFINLTDSIQPIFANSGYLPLGSKVEYQCGFPYTGTRNLTTTNNTMSSICKSFGTTNSYFDPPVNCSFRFCPVPPKTELMTRMRLSTETLVQPALWASFVNASWYPSGTLVKIECAYNQTGPNSQILYCTNDGYWQTTTVMEANSTISLQFDNGGIINCTVPETTTTVKQRTRCSTRILLELLFPFCLVTNYLALSMSQT